MSFRQSSGGFGPTVLRSRRVMVLVWVVLLAVTSPLTPAQCEDAEGQVRSADDVARDLANPNTPLASLTLKSQLTLYDGKLPDGDEQTSGTLLFQPVLPFALSNGDKLIFRPALPLLIGQPVFDATNANFDSESGLGDVAFDLAYAKTLRSGLLLATGVVSTLPTATSNDIGREQWSLGPELLVGYLSQRFILGAFPNHQWDVAGDGQDVSLTTVQLFAVGLPSGGWSVGSFPIMSYDHEGEEWTVPLNLGVGRTMVLGTMPWKFGVELNYYVEAPGSFGPKWMFQLTITPVVKNRVSDALSSWLKR